MAGTEYGKDWQVCAGDGATPEVFTPIGGETSFDWKTATDKIDLSTKGDGNLKAQGFGQSSIDFAVQGKVKVPDASLSAIYDASQASPNTINIQVKTRAGVIKYEGQVGVGNFSCSAPNGDAVTYSFDMSATQTPTVNSLMAVGA